VKSEKMRLGLKISVVYETKHPRRLQIGGVGGGGGVASTEPHIRII
jgi:hypothetical protein